jgi:dGTPase
MDPRLAIQQHGQRRIITDLFNIYAEVATKDDRRALFPLEIRERLEETSTDHQRFRIVADFISALSESQAVKLYQRLTGISPGPALSQIAI